jgi:tRNA dimethylallyltransferase
MPRNESTPTDRPAGHDARGLPDAVLIAGPTASGKSALAMKLAHRLRGVVINCDSMQVYRDLRIITARPTPADEGAVPHRLFGYVDAAENWSAGRWLNDARMAIAQAKAAGRLPILAGGTGLYFKALTAGLAAVPAVPRQVRDRIRQAAAHRATSSLHADLSARDPTTASRLRPSDRQRIIRALEVFEATGMPLAKWQEGRHSPPLVEVGRCVALFLTPARDELRARIDERFEAMLAQGALEEVRALAARDLDPALPAMRAHGVPWLMAHLRGEISLERAAAEAKADTRRYAKRQFTWFRNQMPGWRWCAPREGERAVLDALGADTERAAERRAPEPGRQNDKASQPKSQ